MMGLQDRWWIDILHFPSFSFSTNAKNATYGRLQLGYRSVVVQIRNLCRTNLLMSGAWLFQINAVKFDCEKLRIVCYVIYTMCGCVI
jgi:hypothetical protein